MANISTAMRSQFIAHLRESFGISIELEDWARRNDAEQS
jgi:hypothetical protein